MEDKDEEIPGLSNLETREATLNIEDLKKWSWIRNGPLFEIRDGNKKIHTYKSDELFKMLRLRLFERMKRKIVVSV
jgi:hypothetical protein